MLYLSPFSHQNQPCAAPFCDACKNPNIGPPKLETWLQILLAQLLSKSHMHFLPNWIRIILNCCLVDEHHSSPLLQIPLASPVCQLLAPLLLSKPPKWLLPRNLEMETGLTKDFVNTRTTVPNINNIHDLSKTQPWILVHYF